MNKPTHSVPDAERTPPANAPGTASVAAPGAPAAPDKARCPSCHAVIEAGDEYCRHCGRRQVRSGAWYYEPGAIAVLALTVLGPFAIPLIWKSPRISMNAKVAWTVMLSVTTAILVWCLWYICSMFLAHWREFNQLMRQMG